ncbi:MAG: oligosaccharide flippase family protein [Bacteroidota bacterium]|nr:oligosaccharide flippase family protein [Bacteroidota bacterium]
MKKRIRMLNDFLKNTIKIMSSSSLAQLTVICITPLLTQFFSPEEFGIYAFYISVCTIFGSIANGKFDIAIMLPKKNIDSVNIFILSILISFTFSVLILIVLYLFKNLIFRNEYVVFVKLYYVFPITIFFIGLNSSILSFFNRQTAYNEIAKNNVIKSTTNSFSSLFLGIKKIATGMIIGNLISLTVTLLVNFSYIKNKINKRDIKRTLIISNFIKYIDFIRFSTISNFFNSVSSFGITTIIILFFGPKVAGLYFLAEKIFAVPISILTSSISQVYFEKASRLFYRDKFELLQLTLKIQKNIFKILFPSLLFLCLLGEILLNILGEEWSKAGAILKFISVYILFKNIYSPISHIGDILNKQKQLLLFNFSIFSFQVISFVALNNFNDLKLTLLTSSFFGAVHYILLDYYMKKELKKMI